MKKITKKSTLAEILEIPGSESVLVKHKLPCVFCPMAKFEVNKLEIGRVCEIYGIEPKSLLEELNNTATLASKKSGNKKSKGNGSKRRKKSKRKV